MTTNRREFIGQLAGGATMLGTLPIVGGAETRAIAAPSAKPGEPWDLSWTKRISVKHRAVFDVPEIESGYGVWRASVWMNQYRDVLGATEKDMCSVLVLRHVGIVLALQQSFWDEYGIGKAKSVVHPITLQPTDRNPALMGEQDGVPAPFNALTLDKFIKRGGIALACNVAFGECVDLVKTKHSLNDDDARKRAMAMLVPGVILQPSGVFAAVRAQEAGAVYVRAS